MKNIDIHAKPRTNMSAEDLKTCSKVSKPR